MTATTHLRINIDGVEMLRVPAWLVRADPAFLGSVLLQLPEKLPLKKDGTIDAAATCAAMRLAFHPSTGIGDMPIGCTGWGPGKKITIELMEYGQ